LEEEGISLRMTTADHPRFAICEELTIVAALLNDLDLLSVLKKDFVDGTELLVLENRCVAGADYIVYHLSTSHDLMIDLNCGLDFSFEIDIHFVLVICFVVEICLGDQIYLSPYLVNGIDIGSALLIVTSLLDVIDHRDFVLGGENPKWIFVYPGLEMGRFFGFVKIREEGYVRL
jgi:hypothetical protein